MAQRLVGYIRVSSKAGRDDDRFLSPDLQRVEMERWAATRYPDAEWIAWHIEIDRTGMTQSRPVLVKALADAQEVSAALVVFALSRWARSVEGGLRDMDRMRDAGVRIESASEPVEMESAIGRFGVQILLAVAELEVGQKAEGWQSTIRANKEDGWWHGVVPLGYRRPSTSEAEEIGRSSGVIVPDASACEIVIEAFHRASVGESIEVIGAELVHQGVFRRRGTIYDVLRNRVYLGEVKLPMGKRVRQKNLDGTIRTDNHGRPRYQYEGHRWVDGKHEAIVDRSVFAAVGTRLRASPRSRPRRSRSMWWGSGRVRCALCEYALVRDPKASGTYLRCNSRRLGSGCAGIATPRVDLVEGRLVYALRAALEGLVLPTDPSSLGGASERAQAEMEAAEARLGEGLAEALRLGLSQRERDALLSVLRADVATAVAALQAVDKSSSLAPEVAKDVVRLANELADRWTEMGDDARRAALAALDVQVFIGSGGGITLRAPWHGARAA